MSFDDIKFNSEYSPNDIQKITKGFVDMVKYLKQNESYFSSVVNECDKALGDLYHYCELHYPTDRSGKTKVVQGIRDISITRRKAKDMLELTDSIIKLDTPIINDVYKMSNTVTKSYIKLFLKERVYVPRVLNELFEDEAEIS